MYIYYKALLSFFRPTALHALPHGMAGHGMACCMRGQWHVVACHGMAHKGMPWRRLPCNTMNWHDRALPARPWHAITVMAWHSAGLGGRDRLGWGHLKRLYKAPTDYTKPRQAMQRHERLDKDLKCYTFELKIGHKPKRFNRSSNKY